METEFSPNRRGGLIFHILLILLLGGGSGISFWLAVQQKVGGNFVVFILTGLLLFAPLPVLVYRGYALLTAFYAIDRDGLRLRWGLRGEDIPLPEIEWIRPASDLAFDLPIPRLSTPGAVLGLLNVRDLGAVEFLASNRRELLLVATPTRVYAISPADPAGFVRAFRSATEMGSITPLPSFSTRPVAFLMRVWTDRAARWLILVGLALVVVLFVLVGLIIPARASISLGYTATGQPLEPGPAASLLLLPVLGVLAFVMDLIGGLFFYRRDELRGVAYLLWVASLMTSAMLLVATLIR